MTSRDGDGCCNGIDPYKKDTDEMAKAKKLDWKIPFGMSFGFDM